MKQLKSKKHYKCILKDDKIIKQTLYQKESFNTKGQLIQAINYDTDGKSYAILNNKYKESHLTETERIDLINDVMSKQMWIDKDDKLATERNYFNETDYIDTNYTYNSKGDLLKWEKIDDEGILFEYETFTYNEQYSYKIGKLYKNGILIQTTKTYYDKSKNPVEIISKYFFYDFDLSLDEVLTHEIIESYTYNNDNEWSTVRKFKRGILFYDAQIFLNEYKDVEHKLTTIEGVKYDNFYFYDDQQRSVREEEYINSELQLISEMKYDEHDEIIENKITTQISEHFYEVRLYQSEPVYWE